MKCIKCGSSMTKTVGDHVYRESGMEHVTLRNVAKLSCEVCGDKRIQITAMGQLHRALAQAIAHKPARLIPSEVRFLRDHLELNNIEFAALMGVTPTQSSRWTTTDPIGMAAERFLRLLAALGPDAVRAEDQLQETRASSVKVGEVYQVIKHLPPQSAETKTVKIGLRRSSAEGWKQEGLAA